MKKLDMDNYDNEDDGISIPDASFVILYVLSFSSIVVKDWVFLFAYYPDATSLKICEP